MVPWAGRTDRGTAAPQGGGVEACSVGDWLMNEAIASSVFGDMGWIVMTERRCSCWLTQATLAESRMCG